LRYVEVVQLDLQREFHRAREKTASLYSVPQLPVLSTTAPARLDLATIRQAIVATHRALQLLQPQLEIRIAANFADSHSGFSTSTTNSITSPQNECTLAGQSAVIRLHTTELRNGQAPQHLTDMMVFRCDVKCAISVSLVIRGLIYFECSSNDLQFRGCW
jgi:hypothetical protein